jgi:hypothetical protein
MSTQSRIGWRPYVTQVVNAVDADATAFIAAAGITNLTQAAAINTLVNDLKTYGLWTKMKALYPMVGGSAASHKFNLKDPRDLDVAYRLVFNGGWVHSSTGAKPNGTTGYADTKLIPSVNISNVNSVSISNYSRTQDTSFNGVQIGCYDGSNGQANELNAYQYYSIISRKGGSCYQYSIEAVLSTETNTKGFLLNSRTSSSIFKLFFNNNLLNTNTTIRTGNLPTRSLYIGASNWFNGTNQYSPHEHAFDSIGDGLTDTEASNFYTSVQKFQTTLGRHVGTPYVSDPDAIAFLNAAGITDGTQAAAINTLVIRMKADGVWTKMKAIYPFVGGTATAHKFNLKDPRDLDVAYRLVFNGGITHTYKGVLFNGTTGYADTKLTPNIMSLNSQHMSFYTRIEGSTQMGVAANGYNFIDTFDATTFRSPINLQNYTLVSSTISSRIGFFIGNRNTSTNISIYKDVNKLNDNFIGSQYLETYPIYISGLNRNTSINVSASNEYIFSTIGDGLTDIEAKSLYNSVQAFQTTLGRQVNIPLVSDTDAQTFLNAANITSFQQASAVNKLVVDLKAAGVWTKMKAIYPFVGGSAASHKFNLKDPRDLNVAYRLVFNGGWAHSSTGALPNGTTGYADTFFIPSASLTNNSSHLSFYSRTNRVTGRQSSSIGSYLNPNEISLRFNFLASGSLNNSSMSAQYDGTGLDFATYTTSTTNYFLIGNRTANNINKVYENGVLKSTNTTTTTKVLPSARVLIGALSDGNTNVIWYDNLESAFATIGDGLTDVEATSLYTAVQTYQTSLGRAVNTPVYNNSLVLNLDAGNANSYPGTGTTWFDLATSTNGSLVNSPTFNSNQFTFNGTNQFVNFGNINNIGTDSVTLAAWIKTTGNQDYAGIIGKAFYGDKLGRFSLHTRTGGKLGIITHNLQGGTLQITEVISTQNINTGNWFFVVGVIDRSYGNKLYINGVLDGVSTRDTSGVNWSTTDNFTIGFYNGNGSGYFNGSISNAFMYRRVLTDNEIINLYNSTRGRFGL